MRLFKISFLLTVFLGAMAMNLVSASTDAINYQTVVRDADGEPMANENIELRISILSGSATGNVEYEETHDVTTNEHGLINVKIGRGTVETGTFADIDWAADEHHLEVEVDGEVMGTQEFVSVPYAQYSLESGSVDEMELEELSDVDLTGLSDDQILYYDGNNWVVKDEEGSNWSQVEDDIIYNEGNVGIGVDTPDTRLHVGGDLNSNGNLRINADSSENIGQIYFGNNNSRINHSLSLNRLSFRGVDQVDLGNITIIGGIPFISDRVNLSVVGGATIMDSIEAGQDVIADGEIRANANASTNLTYYRFRDETGSSGPRIYHRDADDDITFSGAGEVRVFGDFSATGSKNFKIDHPEDPENKYLYHAAIESDERYNKYSGNITTDKNGVAVVELPSYVEAVNKDFRYNLTVIGTFAQAIIDEEVQDGQFVIRTEEPDVKVSWELTGVRDDPYARENPYEAEVTKGEHEQGYYINPELYDQPADRTPENAILENSDDEENVIQPQK